MVVSAWVAVIVTVPVCKIETVDPDTLAMELFELAYENAPTVLSEVGGVNVNVPPFEYVRFAIVNPVTDGVGLSLVVVIVNVAVALPET